MRKARRDALAVLLVVEVGIRERECLRTGAGNATRRCVAHNAPACGPVHLSVRLAASGFPVVDAALLQVVAHEGEVLVARGIAGHAPLLALLRQVTVAEQD